VGDKSELLNQLKIDRTEHTETGGLSPLIVGVIATIALFVGGFGALFLFGGETPVSEKAVAQTVAPQNSAGTENSANSVDTPAAAPVIEQPANRKILDASGYITARRIATVSSQVLGLITEVRVEEGMFVEKDQILAKLDGDIAAVNLKFAEAQLAATEARVGSIKANLSEAERVLARATKLNASNYSSEASVTRAQANVDSLKANLVSADADITVARLEVKRQRERLEYFTITAPFAGVVTVKNAQPGEIVSPSSAGGGFTRTGICTIVDMASLEIEVDVNEAFIGRVFAGQRVEANLDAYPDWDIAASVIAIIPAADRAKATVRVRIKIEDKDSRILPDMGVRVAFLKA